MADEVTQKQYCQTRNINILNRVCRELTRLSRSKHTLVNILIIDFTITKIQNIDIPGLVVLILDAGSRSP